MKPLLPTRLASACLALLAVSAAPPAAGQADARPVGVVRPSREVVLKAPLAGVLAEVLVEEGAAVAAGQPLARMDDAVQAARVAAARVRAAATAEADELAASADAARRDLSRTREAAGTGAAPPWELEAAQTAVTIAEARHAAALHRGELAAAELAVEEALLQRHRLAAPFTGTVLAVEADAGASLTPADPVLRLAALDPLEATVHVPVTHHRALGSDRLGRGVRLHPTLPGVGPLDATLTASLPEVDPGSRSFRCVLRIENPGGSLPAGFTVALEVPTAEPLADAAD